MPLKSIFFAKDTGTMHNHVPSHNSKNFTQSCIYSRLLFIILDYFREFVTVIKLTIKILRNVISL